MRRSARVRVSRAVVAALVSFSWLAFATPAQAATYTVSEESDWYFEVESDDTSVVIYGNSNSSCTQMTSDPYLWVYDLSGTAVAWNDDGNHNSDDQCVS